MEAQKRFLENKVLPHILKVSKNFKHKDVYYRIANNNILVKYYTPAFASQCIRALAHAKVSPNDSVNLVVNVWDSAEANLEPLVIQRDATFSPIVETQRERAGQLNREGLKCVFFPAEETLNIYDQASGQAYLWTHDANNLSTPFVAAPMRILLHWFLSRHNISLMHGAVIEKDGNGVLLTAKGGSGKSTTTLASLLSGMDSLGDDYVAVDSAESVVAYSLYGTLKASPETLADKIFSKVKADIVIAGEKSIIFMENQFPGKLKQKTNIKAIFMPNIKRLSRTSITPATKLQAALAIAPTTVFQLPFESAVALQRMKQAVSKTPCYMLNMSSDPFEVAQAIREFLQNS